jgi:general secretion pathway protein G
MTIPVVCRRFTHACGRWAHAPDDADKVRCPHCGAAVRVPEAEPLSRRQGRTNPLVTLVLVHTAVLLLCVLGVAAVVGLTLLSASSASNEQSRRETAKVQAGQLTKACQTYAVDHGNYPPSLEALLQRDAAGGPYVSNPVFLRDPWGNPYQYDPAGPRNGGRLPDIWAQPRSGAVGNWGP